MTTSPNATAATTGSQAPQSIRLALFDLDHTLIPLDSDYAWGEFTVAQGWRDAATFSLANDRFYAAYKAGTLDIHEYVHFATAAVREQGMLAANEAHERFMQEVIRPAMREKALAVVKAHQAAGDQVVIVTATNAFVTRPIATAFGVDELIAIDLETDAAGTPTGLIRGVPSFREGKVARVEQWLAARGLNWASVAHSTFYSDSINDLPLLEKVHEPVATNPDDRLKAIALERGWRILNLFE
ncbi:HAD superfamily hydrolase (TIGR01490 family) [Hydrogenophaga palleronii]|uniref:HAD superfamily hydrolase (TIGR01490 family) n=1 Tax=Hydrogenophaga palleronii TaxID=65655 RepID=A0ABU1WUR5_9BURK|nr:HAD family hydrolase [Hydrogenophaga palleronii]MDR7153053.1 HAD superfamily hydrolase (TIGR01490 family) [Hydrogenophaga palleronii]